MEQKKKIYDLDERTFAFAKGVREFITVLPKNLKNQEDVKQLIRSSGSVGANYIEASNFLGKKDFILRIKICRKEAQESAYWLRLLDCDDKKEILESRAFLLQEAQELTNIFGAIVRKNE